MTGPTATEARAVGIADDAWPYGPNVDHQARRELVAWSTPRRLRYSPHGSCLHWISRGRCSVQVCDAGANRHRWLDHVTGWVRTGRAALLIAQPYDVDLDALEDIVTAAHRHHLTAAIRGTGSYGHGTTLIELRPASAVTAAGERGHA